MFDDAALTESKKYEHKFLINIQHASLKKKKKLNRISRLFKRLSEIKLTAGPTNRGLTRARKGGHALFQRAASESEELLGCLQSLVV